VATSSRIFGRSSQVPPTAVRGQGCYIFDANGKRYLDGSGGAAVSCLGHSDADVSAAIKDQLDNIAFAHTGFFTSEPAEALADLLAAQAPGDLNRVYFVSGGSEAVEAAIKLARQYFLETGAPERSRIIARRQSYHGNTLGALGAGRSDIRRTPFAPLFAETSHISPCYAYRGQADDEDAFDYGQRVAGELEVEIKRLGAENVMAFIAEPVVGAALGAVPAVTGYFKRIRQICDDHGVLLILDEVMCGMGRTGTLFACEQEGIVPDMVTFAKGLGGGYQPIGAMMCTGKIYDAIAAGSGAFLNGHTYMGHPVATAASRAVLGAILERDLLASVGAQGDKLEAALQDAFGQHPHIGDIRGRGLFRGLEIVADRETKNPFEADRGIAMAVKAAAFDAGLICYPSPGTADGKSGDHVLLAPPFIISDAQIDELVEKLGLAFKAVL